MILKVLIDAILINFSFILAYYLRFKILLIIIPTSYPIFEQYLRTLILVTILWLAVFRFVGLYDEKRFTALIDEIAMLLWGVSLSSLLLLGLLFLYREFWFSRLVIVNAWWISFLLLGLSRVLIFETVRLFRLYGIGVRNILILGFGDIGQTLVSKMIEDKGLGCRPVGFLDKNLENHGKNFHEIPVFGGFSKIGEAIQQYNVKEVIVADPSLSADQILDLITNCERLGVEFKIVPGILELIATRIDADELAGVPLLTVSEIKLKGLNAFVKRTIDIVFSTVGLVLLSPIFLVIAVLIKLTSPGPVFFVQDRVGIDGKIFKMFKFRSMIEDADKLFPQLEPLSETEGYLFKMKRDPRVTPLGRFLRRYSLDELPQLINVFLGDMSLVGPRPPLPREVEKYNEWHKKRLRVRPGITGPWQVSGRSLLPFDDMVRLDIYYIENWSLWLDIKILLRTIPVVLLGRGAY